MLFAVLLLSNFYMRSLIVLATLLFVAACGSNDQKSEPGRLSSSRPLAKSANSDSFNTDFRKIMSAYYNLQDGFVNENDTTIERSAQLLMTSVDSFTKHQLVADTGIIATAQTYTLGISSELKGLLGEKELEEKRKSFQMVSDQLYDLIRTVQYDREIIYHLYCPMAFNGQGANWLSKAALFRNPYIPKKMISCGEVKDSIDFRTRQ